MRVDKTKDLPPKAVFEAQRIRFKRDRTYNDKRRRDEDTTLLQIVGNIPAIGTEGIAMSNVWYKGEPKALWVKNDSTEQDIHVGEAQVTNAFFKVFGIRNEKDIAPRKYPLIRKPPKNDEDSAVEYYVINMDEPEFSK